MPTVRSIRATIAHLQKEFRLLNATDRWTLMRVVYLLPLRTLQLRAFGLSSFRSHTQPLPPAANEIDSATAIALARRIYWLMSVAANRGICRGSCLSRSLVLRDLLAQKGIGCEVRIGVRHRGPEFDAHAWVEVDGTVVNDSADTVATYAPIHSLCTER